ncbi:hypothetical protein [Polaribacter dokdonensis]|uniref:Uncharacterized protein n=1 Tax=Polaribacter dokdonensis DSW-5 TaxID=1300348 RepID=A0A0M9CE48_9FLAO|nr:hypothetical protein [Polaribacter dokdonensis]KOY50781.1 hypothetical protein I602_341 [Polaribacter dokdonensis DSW-5]SEE26228.1 hypothetical protein SAMN05444353_1443 [Polaribacter dokdonensis DSW-5]
MNKEEEKHLINKIKFKAPFSRLKNITYTEQPDLICNLNNNIIGIEITECFQDDTIKGSKLKESRSFKNKIGKKLIEIIKLDIPFHLTIDIDKKINLKNNQLESFINDLKKTIENKIDIIHNNTLITIDEDIIYANGVKSIDLFFTNDLKTNSYGETDYGKLSVFTNMNLNYILNKKESKLIKYASCDEYWLVIREGDMIAASFSKIDLKPYLTKFDRIFMYRIFKDELLEL